MKFRRRRLIGFVLLPTLIVAAVGVYASALEPISSPAVKKAADFDLQRFIDDRIAAGERHLVIPAGRHLVTPRNRQHLVLKNLKNVIIDATGAELVCTRATRAISITDCDNLTLRGLVIDYDPLPFTQARIVTVSPDRTRVDFEILPGYPDLPAKPYSTNVEIFDPASNWLRPGRTLHETKIEATQADRGYFLRSVALAADATEQVGDIAVFDVSAGKGGQLPHAIYATNSRGLVFENVTVYASPTFSFLEISCDGSRYVGCRVDRRPPEGDPQVRGYRRLRSGNADAFHSKQARQGPRYERCSAYFMGDDAIAINGDFHVITGVERATLRVIAKNTMRMRVGERVQLLAHDGRRLDDRHIIAIEPAGEATAEDRRIISLLKLIPRVAASGLKSSYAVTLDAPVALAPGSYLCSADAIGNGFVIENCEVGHNRSRGILVKAGGGRIANNRVVGSVMTGILVSPEPWWLEGGFSDNLVIENNTVANCGGIGLMVSGQNRDKTFFPAGAFRDVTVRHNTITGGPAPGLVLTSIRGLKEENNTVATDPTKPLPRWQVLSWGKGPIADQILLNND